MIVDASALLAVYFEGYSAAWTAEQVRGSPTRLRMSTVNFTECLLRFALKGPAAAAALWARLRASGIEFVPPDIEQAMIAANARDRFPFNLGDCFAYARVKTIGEPLFTLDRDFRSADVAVGLS